MISLRDKVVGESIISSTKAGKSGMLERAEEWLKEHNIRNYEINDDGKFEIWEREIIITEPIPDFVNIKKVRTIALKTKEALQGNMPEQARELIIKDTDIDDFKSIENVVIDLLVVNNCNVKSLKNLPKECLQLYIGDNKEHFVKKDIKKLVKTKEALQGNMPEQARELIIKDIDIDDFKPIENVVIDLLVVNNCNVKSLKNLPKECLQLYLGDNKEHFVKKDIKKLVKTKPTNIYTLGYYSTYFQSAQLGLNDIEYIEKEAEKIKKILSKEIPELKTVGISAKKDGHFVWIRLDFLNKEDHPHNISDNSIYLDFRYTISDSSLELSGQGHLNLTDADKKGKYQYYALKGFSAPYIDNGGKKFRKVRLDDFNAKEVTDKIVDWTKDVVKAAIEDQGGDLKRK
jgi:hypothetical protein